MLTTTQIGLFVSGALTAGYWIAALFFVRFWRRSGDRLFMMFAAAFFLLGAQRVALTIVSTLARSEVDTLWPFLIRLIAFSIILYAIVDKNRDH